MLKTNNKLKYIISLSIEKYLISASAFATVILIGKYDIEKYSTALKIQAFAILISVLSVQPVVQTLQKKINNEYQKINLINSTLALQFYITLASSLIFSTLYYLNYDYELLLIVTILFGNIAICNETIRLFHLNNNQKLKPFTLVTSALIISWLIKILWLNFFQSNLHYLLTQDAIIVFLALYIFTPEINIKHGDIKEGLRIAAESKYLIFAGALSIFAGSADLIIASEILKKNDFAFYATSYKFIGMYYIIAASLAVIQAKSISINSRQSIRMAYFESLSTGLSLTIISILLTPFLIEYFYGNKFTPEPYLISILSCMIASTFLHNTTGRILIELNLQRIVLAKNMVILLLTAANSVVFGILFGANGIALSAIISSLLGNIVIPFTIRKFRHAFQFN